MSEIAEYTKDEVMDTFIKDYPEGFDVKDIHEDLNTCDKCGIIAIWYSELYWQGEEYFHKAMQENNFDALCDKCHKEICC